MRALVLVVAVLSSCRTVPPAQVLVELTADSDTAARATFLEIVVEDAVGVEAARFVDPASDVLPATVPLIPRDGDASRIFAFRAALYDTAVAPVADDRPFVQVQAQGGYVDDELRSLPLRLGQSCSDLGDRCGVGQTCYLGACRGACFDTLPADFLGPAPPRCGACATCDGNACRPLPDATPCGCPDQVCGGGSCGYPESARVRSVAAGLRNSCAVRGDRVYCWGSNAYDELGVPGVVDRSTTPTEVSTTGRAVSTRGSLDGTMTAHTCVLASSSVSCWGKNRAGQLGTGDRMDRDSPAPVVEPAGVTFAQVSVGGIHTCARGTGGQLFCWGSADRGQCGTGDEVVGAYDVPTQVDLAGATWSDVSAGQIHTCGIADGVVYCWGLNASGQLGIPGVTENRFSPEAVASPGRGVETDWVEVAAGDFHSCARKLDGEVWCWGGNSFGNLGRGTMEDDPTPAPVEGAQRFQVLRCGRSHCCGIEDGGDLACWGRNDQGQLGVGTAEDTRPRPTRVESAGTWVDVGLGERHSCGVSDGGAVFCWGLNDEGQLGLGHRLRHLVPTPVCL